MPVPPNLCINVTAVPGSMDVASGIMVVDDDGEFSPPAAPVVGNPCVVPPPEAVDPRCIEGPPGAAILYIAAEGPIDGKVHICSCGGPTASPEFDDPAVIGSIQNAPGNALLLAMPGGGATAHIGIKLEDALIGPSPPPREEDLITESGGLVRSG